MPSREGLSSATPKVPIPDNAIKLRPQLGRFILMLLCCDGPTRSTLPATISDAICAHPRKRIFTVTAPRRSKGRRIFELVPHHRQSAISKRGVQGYHSCAFPGLCAAKLSMARYFGLRRLATLQLGTLPKAVLRKDCDCLDGLHSKQLFSVPHVGM